jgi:hypothetical protein
MSQKKFLVLIGLILGGFFMLFIPSPLDIGESILLQMAKSCQTEQCIQNSNNLLNSYHAGGLILSIGSILVLIKGLIK